MKKLAITIFSMLISFGSYGGWMEFANSGDRTYYIDTDKVKKHKEHIYWWVLSDYLIPSNPLLDYSDSSMSSKTYYQGDCAIFRIKQLSYIRYKQPMGVESLGSINLEFGWEYPDSTTTGIGVLLNYACNYVE